MKILITGGAGLVGSHAAEYYALKGDDVIVLDNLMRSELFGYNKESVEYNWNYLARYENVERIKGDVREEKDVAEAIGDGVDVVIHTAGQPGVPLSVRIPKEDFSINAFGTLNVLECLRQRCKGATFIYTSSNKVYGENVDKIPLIEKEKRYVYDGVEGVSEEMSTDLTGHTPYGVSKLIGDLYTQEYGRLYGMKTGVFRMSCLSKNAKVATPQGNIKISDIENKKVDVHCFLGKIDTKATMGSFKTERSGKALYKVKTKNGYQIEATGDHMFFTPGGYKSLDNIDYGSSVAVCPEFFFMKRRHVSEYSRKEILSKEKFVKNLNKYGRKKESNIKYVKSLEEKKLLPLSYNNSNIYVIARLVGYLTGDGHLYHRIRPSGKSYTEIQVYALEEEIESIKEDFRKIGFVPGKTRCSRSISKLSTGQVIKGTSYRFSITRTEAFALFELLDVPVGNKSRVVFQVPKWILKGPKDVQNEYLAGLFGAEMSAPSFRARNGENKQELQPPHFTQSKTEKLHKNLYLFRRQVIGMLDAREIETRTYITKANFFSKRDGEMSICYDLLIKPSRENIMNLAKIGFAYNKKRKLELLKIAEFLKFGLPYNYYDEWEKENTYTLGNSGLVWDRIIEKKQIPMDNIYDITVPGHHNFFANGFLVHNCTYGTRQFGFEDQGWVAWFVIANLLEKPITIYGDGKQVRDLLYVTDLIEAFDKFIKSDLRCEVFNIGGGPEHTTSLLEFLEKIEKATGKKNKISFSSWRPSDQKVYISDISRIRSGLNWQPKVDVDEGVKRIIKWVKVNKSIF